MARLSRASGTTPNSGGSTCSAPSPLRNITRLCLSRSRANVKEGDAKSISTFNSAFHMQGENCGLIIDYKCASDHTMHRQLYTHLNACLMTGRIKLYTLTSAAFPLYSL